MGEQGSGPKVLVLYYSMYGHIHRLAEAIAEGAREVPGSEVTLRRTPEDSAGEDACGDGGARGPTGDGGSEVRRGGGAGRGRRDHHRHADALLGTCAARCANSSMPREGCGPKARSSARSAASSPAPPTQHGGQESTILSTDTTLLHHGLVIVGLPYAFAGQMRLDEITGCSPYGASTIAGGSGERLPSENELAGARWQGRHVATIAAKLRA